MVGGFHGFSQLIPGFMFCFGAWLGSVGGSRVWVGIKSIAEGLSNP